MTRRLPSDHRREQIVVATLLLLTRLPVEQITTRRIAAEVGVSQPALFRHFATRSDIFSAVVARSRDVLREGAEAVLASDADWSTTAEALAEVLLTHVTAHPGLPRLFFHDLSSQDKPAHLSRTGLVQMQAGLVADLVRRGQRAGGVPLEVDPDAAGRLFVATMQGAMASTLSHPEDTAVARSAVHLWVAGVRAGVPRSEADAPWSRGAALLALDVRPILARGEEPLDAILDAVAGLDRTGLLILTAPFRPGPLLSLLSSRGFRVEVTEAAAGHWELVAFGPDSPPPLDTRDLEAPEPLEAILFAAASLGMDDVLIARVPRVPRLLFPLLKERDLAWTVHECADGTALLHVRPDR